MGYLIFQGRGIHVFLSGSEVLQTSVYTGIYKQALYSVYTRIYRQAFIQLDEGLRPFMSLKSPELSSLDVYFH